MVSLTKQPISAEPLPASDEIGLKMCFCSYATVVLRGRLESTADKVCSPGAGFINIKPGAQGVEIRWSIQIYFLSYLYPICPAYLRVSLLMNPALGDNKDNKTTQGQQRTRLSGKNLSPQNEFWLNLYFTEMQLIADVWQC